MDEMDFSRGLFDATKCQLVYGNETNKCLQTNKSIIHPGEISHSVSRFSQLNEEHGWLSSNNRSRSNWIVDLAGPHDIPDGENVIN